MSDGGGRGGADGEGASPNEEAPPARVARFLRQRRELGGDLLFLDELGRSQVLELLRRFREGAAGSRAVQTIGAASASGQAGADAGGANTPASPADTAPTPDDARAVQEGSKGEETVKTFDYDTLEKVALACERCRLAEGRTQVVFSDGNPDGRLMVVGEAPGAREDRTGLPFVGPAGKLLDLLLTGVDLSREETAYICNVIKCRPPGNRNPLPDEIEACAPYLRRQIELVRPEAILAVGTFAGQLLTGRSSTLGKLRGEVYSYEGVPLVVTYHPAALLRNRSWTRSTWNDLQLLRQVLDGG